MTTLQQTQDELDLKRGLIPAVIMLVLWALALARWVMARDLWTPLLLAYGGVFSGIGLGLYLALPRKKRDRGRRVMMLMVGGLLLFTALYLGQTHGNMQIEGLFFALLIGTAHYIVLHYVIAKVAGPVVFGRVWCGWACWFGMIFDLLPYPHSRYRIAGHWPWFRYVHLIISLIVVLGLWFGLGYQGGALGPTGVLWFVVGLTLYYALGVGLAFWLKDNRAFCKYVCPIAALQKVGARSSVLRVSGDASHCEHCIACMEMCPMNIRIRDYLLAGERVRSTECTLCQTCINVCPHQSLTLSFGFDPGGKERIDFIRPRKDWKAERIVRRRPLPEGHWERFPYPPE